MVLPWLNKRPVLCNKMQLERFPNYKINLVSYVHIHYLEQDTLINIVNQNHPLIVSHYILQIVFLEVKTKFYT
jgi:hypothetical protein